MSSENWIYMGVFLTPRAKEILQEKFGNRIPKDWKVYMHHMTLVFNKHDEKSERMYNLYKDLFGKEYELTITGIGVSDRAIAARVMFDKECANKIPHVTIAVAPDAKPVESNDITEWEDVEPFDIKGVLGEYKK